MKNPVNLYSFGGGTLVPVKKEKNVRFRPSIGIGTGTGGFGGMGMGGGISIGGGRNSAPEPPIGAPVVRYFIEKSGTGPLQEIPIKAITEEERKAEVRNILLQKLGDQPALKGKIEANTIPKFEKNRSAKKTGKKEAPIIIKATPKLDPELNPKT